MNNQKVKLIQFKLARPFFTASIPHVTQAFGDVGCSGASSYFGAKSRLSGNLNAMVAEESVSLSFGRQCLLVMILSTEGWRRGEF